MNNFLVLFLLFAGLRLTAQDCYENGHSVNIHDSWLSCATAVSPNAIRGESHWVMYDLGYVYSLGATHFWNYNVNGATANGMKNISIDVSENGTNWVEVGSFQLSEAEGNSDYEGEDGMYLAQMDARYVLITTLDTWGGVCAGLSEVRFDLEGTVSVQKTNDAKNDLTLFPNPTDHTIFIQTEMDFKEVAIQNINGQEIIRQAFTDYIDVSSLSSGVYILNSITHSNQVVSTKFVR